MADTEKRKKEEFPIKSGIPVPPKIRHRSPSYPVIGLKDALERTKKFYVVDGRGGAPTDMAAKHIGFASAHGQALSVLSALKKFGLLEDRAGRVVLTQRALELITLPEDDPRRSESLRKAALSPTIYGGLIKQFKANGAASLPSNETLRAELIAYKDFNPNAVDDFIRAFRETLDFSGLSDFSMIESVDEAQSEDAEESGGVNEPLARMRNPTIVRVVNNEEKIPVNPASPTATPHSWTWTLSIPRNVKADLRIAGDVTRADIARLKKQIEFIEDSFEEETEQ